MIYHIPALAPGQQSWEAWRLKRAESLLGVARDALLEKVTVVASDDSIRRHARIIARIDRFLAATRRAAR